MSRPGFLLCAIAAFVASVLSSILMAFLSLPLVAGSSLMVGFSHRGSTEVVRDLAIVVLVLVVLRTVIAALITMWIISVAGAQVSFGRAVGALLAGSLVAGLAAAAGVVYGNVLGSGGYWLVWLAGFLTTVLTLNGGGVPIEREGGYTYKVPPGAPPGWPGTDGS
jgi:hypothetical protein